MKLWPLSLALFFLWFAASSCSLFEEEEVTLKTDLQHYLEEARSWAPMEAQINGPIETVERSYYADDHFVLSTLKPVVSLAQDYVGKLEDYEPQTLLLQGLHRRYIEAWRSHELACRTIVEAMEKKDYILLAKGTQELRRARSALRDVLAELYRLMRKEEILSPKAPPPSPAVAGNPSEPQ